MHACVHSTNYSLCSRAMAQPSLPVADGFGMQCSGGSLLRTPGRTSFRSESSEGQGVQPEITATEAVAMLLPQMEELLDDHVIKRPPRLPCEEVLAARKEFEQWQTRARTIMHAYAAAASQFFLRVAFVAWASKWQRPVQASYSTSKTQRRLTDLRECLDAWASLSKRGAKAKESLRLLSWSQDRALRRSSFVAWKSETLRLQRDMQLVARRQGASVLHLTFGCWQSETSRLRRQRKLMNGLSSPTPPGRSLLKEAFHCLRVETAQRRFRKKLMHAAAGWVQPRKSLHKAVFACWRIETARQRLGSKRRVAAIERQTNTGQSMHKAAFAVWRAETSRLQHCRLLVDVVSDWIGADRSAGLVLLTFKVWQQVLGTTEAVNTENPEEEHLGEHLGEHKPFLLWKSAMMRTLQLELRCARLSETYWMHSAMTLAVFRGWSYFARRSARIKVSLSAGNFAVQRLVLGAWKLVVSGKGEKCETKPFSTPRRPMDSLRKDPPGSRSTERSPVLSEEHDQAKKNEKMEKIEKNGEANTKLSRPRTLLEQLHWKAAQFSHPHVERPSIPVRSRDRKDLKGSKDHPKDRDCPRDHPKNLPTPNRRGSEPRKADGPKERIARQVRGSQGSPEPLAQLRLKLQDLQNFSADG